MPSNISCTCSDWLDNIDKLNSGFVLSHVHGGEGYTGEPFHYCPWCGEHLTSVAENKDEAEAGCSHEWISADNEAVQGAEICFLCKRFRSKL